MKKVIFNKYIFVILLVVLIFSIAVKIHSSLSFPEIGNWNYDHLRMIDQSQNEFSFAVFGDNKNAAKDFDTLIDRVNQDNVSFAIADGDLVYDGDKEKYAFFIKQMNRFEKPCLTAVGNHDIKKGGRANYYDLFGPFYYSFTVGESYFIVLDDADEHNLDPFQMDWLEGELKKSRQYKYRFVIMHVPLYDPRESGEALGHAIQDPAAARELNSLFNRSQVTMIFASHIHRYMTGTWGATPFIITGGAGWLERLAHDAWLYIYSYTSTHFWAIVTVLVLAYLALFFFYARKKSRPEEELADVDQ
jgi:3',5'-cyclic AMP phosphodiesterase CpdA